MSGFTISRRKMLAGSAMLLASTAMPTLGWAQTPKMQFPPASIVGPAERKTDFTCRQAAM